MLKKSIQCDGRISWFHFKYSKLANITFDNLAKSSDAWYCMACFGSMFPFNSIDDYFDFVCRLYSFMHCNVNSSPISNPRQFQLYAKSKLYNRNIDPDKYFYKQVSETDSLYYLEDEFKHDFTKNYYKQLLAHSFIR